LPKFHGQWWTRNNQLIISLHNRNWMLWRMTGWGCPRKWQRSSNMTACWMKKRTDLFETGLMNSTWACMLLHNIAASQDTMYRRPSGLPWIAAFLKMEF
jgi:hypothetical protein